MAGALCSRPYHSLTDLAILEAAQLGCLPPKRTEFNGCLGIVCSRAHVHKSEGYGKGNEGQEFVGGYEEYLAQHKGYKGGIDSCQSTTCSRANIFNPGGCSMGEEVIRERQ